MGGRCEDRIVVSFGEEEEEWQLGQQEEEWSSPKNAEVLAGLRRPGGHSRYSLLGGTAGTLSCCHGDPDVSGSRAAPCHMCMGKTVPVSALCRNPGCRGTGWRQSLVH